MSSSFSTFRRLWSRAGSALAIGLLGLWAGLRGCLWFCAVLSKHTIAVIVTLATIISGIAAAIAAYYARETAKEVFAIEHERLGYERKKYSSDVYQRYVDFIKAAAPLAPCLAALKGLSNDEFRRLWLKPAEFQFQAKDETHARLAHCLQAEAERIRYKAAPEAWGIDQNVAVRATLVIWLNQLDAYFLHFRYNVGNAGILCENMSGLTKISSHASPLRDLIERMNGEGFLEGAEHLKNFIEEYGRGQKPCPSIVEKRVANGFFERLLLRLDAWLDTWLPLNQDDRVAN